ncbi:MAG: dipeptide/oligopeptide/nickel ABC transporter ATP-binding protein [Eubacteriales bacterium]|nr:dipeptide/oligopeptide/nickel ABC transporter ATP-binding protein [Eubacteriales bacterium]
MEKPILELQKVNKIFAAGKENTLHAVKDVSFSLNPGESIGIVGESGSGKSTIARMVMGLTDVTSGKILLDGEDITNYSRKKMRDVYQKVQLVFQDPYSVFSPRMTVGTFLEEGMVYIRKMRRPDAAREAERLMQLVELSPELLERLPHELSGGQLQRVAIARGISVNPKLLVLDEATSALDVSVQKQIMELLVRLKKERSLSYLIVGHDLAVVRSITNRILVMYEGRIVEECSSEHLLTEAKEPYTQKLLRSVYTVD